MAEPAIIGETVGVVRGGAAVSEGAGRFIENLSTDATPSPAGASDDSFEMVEAEPRLWRGTLATGRPSSGVPDRGAQGLAISGLNPPSDRPTSLPIAWSAPRQDAGSLQVPVERYRSASSKSFDGDRPAIALASRDPEKRDSNAPGALSKDNSANDHNADNADNAEELHPLLAKLYPLSHFIGFRPRSHPHLPDDFRLPPDHPRFNRFHNMVGRILSFGLPPLGHAGHVDPYGEAATWRVGTCSMYSKQTLTKLVDAVHSVVAVWTLMALLAFMSRAPFFRAHNAPLVLGAFGAEAVITFVAYRAELAQPKNILFGNAVSAILSVAVTKAFDRTNFTPGDIYGDAWVATATNLAVVVCAMVLLGITHPPGGAVAVLVTTTPAVYALDWYLVPIVIFSSLVVIGWAIIINNLGARRYPGNLLYPNALRQPPMLGPEKFKYHDAPYASRKRRSGDGRVACSTHDAEKGLFRRAPRKSSDKRVSRTNLTISSPIPTPSGRVTPSGWPEGLSPASQSIALPPPRSSVHLGPASPRALQPSSVLPVAPNVPHTTTATTAPTVSSAQTGTTVQLMPVVAPPQSTQAPQNVPTPQSTQPAQPGEASASAPAAPPRQPSPRIEVTPAPAAPAEAAEADLPKRKTSKGSSKKGKHLIQVHINELPGSPDTRGSMQSAASIPAVQWR
ncbi:hypothetical protein ACQY0O_006165 [Thecaphora frezii]